MTDEKKLSKAKKCVETLSTSNKTNVHTVNISCDETSCMSNTDESLSRKCVDFPNVSSDAQAIVDWYMQSQKDLADRTNKNCTDLDSHSAQKTASAVLNERSVKYKERRQQYNTDWKRWARSLPEFREYEQQHNRLNMHIARKHPGYRESERQCNKKSIQMAMEDPVHMDNERHCNKKSMQRWLGNM